MKLFLVSIAVFCLSFIISAKAHAGLLPDFLDQSFEGRATRSPLNCVFSGQWEIMTNQSFKFYNSKLGRSSQASGLFEAKIYMNTDLASTLLTSSPEEVELSRLES